MMSRSSQRAVMSQVESKSLFNSTRLITALQPVGLLWRCVSKGNLVSAHCHNNSSSCRYYWSIKANRIHGERKTKQLYSNQMPAKQKTKQLYSNRTPAKGKTKQHHCDHKTKQVYKPAKKLESTSCTEDSTSSLKHNNNSNKIATPVSLHNALVCGLDRGVCVSCKKPHVSAQLIDGICAVIKKITHNT